ncbi:MAG: DUF5685 family protein [Lachnospiraceae bacterium]|nr:DUF5685 family protein [Lachnospiraceae bacterium]
MFGYVTVNQKELKIKDYDRYRSFYCGLCRMLGKRHGIAGELALTYDMNFLAILLNGLYEKPLVGERHRCLTHPVRRHDMLLNEVVEYAADMGILLAYYKALDDVRDDGSLKARAFAAKVHRSADRVALNYPRQAEAIRTNVEALRNAEDAGEYDLDRIAGYTGMFTAEVFVMQEDEWADELRTIGFYLGKFIYLLDAYDDLDKDVKKGEYNPWTPEMKRRDFEALVENTLMMMMSESAKAFEKLPVIQDVDILRNIIYSGVWMKFDLARKKREEREVGR